MGLETGTYITDLVPTNPTATDLLSQGDDHLRLIKNVTKNSLPNADRPQYFARTSVKTADYLLLITDMERYFVSDATGGAITYSLPALTADDDGWTARFIKDDVSVNTVTIAGTINGDVDGFVLSKQYQDVNLLWTGTEWLAFSPLRFVDGVAVFDDVEVDGILDLTSTSHMILPAGTVAQRPGSPTVEMFRFNTDTGIPEFYDGTSWIGIVGTPRGYIDGCILSNGTDATNDINLTGGVCRDSTNTVDIIVSANTAGKQLDANWVPASTTNTGMRDSSAGIADGTYHIYAARTAALRAGTIYAYPGVDGTDPDSAASIATVIAALQAETGGADYVYARRIGSILRESATIIPFEQNGNNFARKAFILDLNNQALVANTAVNFTAHVPAGLKVIIHYQVSSISNNGVFYIRSATDPDISPSATVAPVFTFGNNTNGGGFSGGLRNTIRCNRSRGLAIRTTQPTNVYFSSLEWDDVRGRDAA